MKYLLHINTHEQKKYLQKSQQMQKTIENFILINSPQHNAVYSEKSNHVQKTFHITLNIIQVELWRTKTYLYE